MDEQGYRERRERRKRRTLLMAGVRLAISAVIFIPLIFLCLWIGSNLLFPKATKVEGVKTEITARADNRKIGTVSIENPAGRDLELQRYDQDERKWVTEKEVELPESERAKVKLKFPKSFSKYTYSKWRLLIKRNFGTSKYVSDEMDVTCTNRGKIKVKCSSAVIYCKDNGKVIFNDHMNKKLPNASTTKMMTAILAFENSDMDDVVRISRRAAITPYSLFPWHKGDKFSMDDLMKSMLIASSNASATAIGEYVGGSYEAFTDMMNERAKELGCKNTHFVTPSGLDANGHHSTAYDIALINAKAIDFPEYNKMIMMKSWKFRVLNDKDREYEVKATNELLKENIKGYLGGKTGTTAQAGNCLSSAYKWKDKTYIITIFNASSREHATKELMRYVRKYA